MAGPSATPVTSASLFVLAWVVGPVVLLGVEVVPGVALVAMAESLGVPGNLV